MIFISLYFFINLIIQRTISFPVVALNPLEEAVKPLLEDAKIWGVNLYEVGMADKVAGYLAEMIAGPGAVRATLKKYV